MLHNPTTAVDAVTELMVAEGLASARGAEARGTVLITNSPALLRITHRVAVIDRGRVVAEGSHDHLLASDARYREEVLR